MERRRKTKYNAEMVQTLFDLGFSPNEIAVKIGVCYATILRGLKKLGVVLKCGTEESEQSKNLKQEVARYYMENHSLQATGDKFGITREYVRQIVNNLGYKTRHWTKTPSHGITKRKKLTSVERFWRKVEKGADDQCWTWQGCLMPNGYGSTSFQGKRQYTHRLAYYFHYKRFPKLCVLHSCDNRKCVNPNHLREGTQQENVHDRNTRGRDKWLEALRNGIKNESARYFVSKEKVLEIESRLQTESVLKIANDLKMHWTTINKIKQGNHWQQKKFTKIV